MKKIKYILLTASVIFMAGCNEDVEFADLNIELLPGKYVAFSASGANNTLPDVDVTEGGTTELNVEVPTGSTSNVTVNFTFSGTAVYGVDFTVTGASAAGGSVVIVPDPGNDPADLIDNVDIDVTFLTDGVTDGAKTLQVTLSSASNSDGEVLVGRGGMDVLRTSVVNIADAD